MGETVKVFTTLREYYRFIQNLELDSPDDEVRQRNNKAYYNGNLIAMWVKEAKE